MGKNKSLNTALVNGSVSGENMVKRGRPRTVNVNADSLRQSKANKKEAKKLALALATEKRNEDDLNKIISKVKESRKTVGTYKKPVLVKDIELPSIDEDVSTGNNIAKLISLSNAIIPTDNIIKFDPLGFTSWNTFERFIRETYDIGLIQDLFLYRKKLTLETKGEKIGYLIVTKQDALTFTDAKRLTRVMLEKVLEKVEHELASLNKKKK